MENKLAAHTKSYTAKAGRRFLALLLSCVLIFSLSACDGQKPTSKAEEIGTIIGSGYMSGTFGMSP